MVNCGEVKEINYEGEYDRIEFAVGIMFASNRIGDLVKHHRSIKWRNQTNRAVVIDVHPKGNHEPVLEVRWATPENTNRLYQSSLELVAKNAKV